MIRSSLAALAALALAACSQPAVKAEAAPPSSAGAQVTPAASTAPAQSPRGFIEDLYAQYRKDENFSPFTHPEQWFDADLLAAIRESEALTPDDDVGAIDSDPLCNCQDASGMMARVDSVEQTSPGAATAKVDLWAGTPDERRIEVDLTASNGTWRVHDVIETGESEGNHSFLTYVREANADARARAVRP
jgi:hypothetical protein